MALYDKKETVSPNAHVDHYELIADDDWGILLSIAIQTENSIRGYGLIKLDLLVHVPAVAHLWANYGGPSAQGIYVLDGDSEKELTIPWLSGLSDKHESQFYILKLGEDVILARAETVNKREDDIVLATLPGHHYLTQCAPDRELNRAKRAVQTEAPLDPEAKTLRIRDQLSLKPGFRYTNFSRVVFVPGHDFLILAFASPYTKNDNWQQVLRFDGVEFYLLLPAAAARATLGAALDWPDTMLGPVFHLEGQAKVDEYVLDSERKNCYLAELSYEVFLLFSADGYQVVPDVRVI